MTATTERNWKLQFPSWPDDITAQAAELEALGFTDESWGNDTCPSWNKEAGGIIVRVWIDTIDPSLRDWEQEERFGITIHEAPEGLTALRSISTNDWSALITTITMLGGK